MDRDGPEDDDRPREDAPHPQEPEADRGPPGNAGSGALGGADFASLLGNPGPGEDQERLRLRCPSDGCDQTGTAADYRKAYWPRCRRHLRRMVLVEAG